MTLLPPDSMRAEISTPIVIIGSGACGLIAALSAREAGCAALVVERDRVPSGSTSLSSGFIPAAGTSYQHAAGIHDDSAERLADDILAKTKQRADRREARRVAAAVGPALDWLGERHAIPFQVLTGFRYPGHSRFRMHAVPERTGTALMARLLAAAEAADIDILAEARVTALFAEVATGLISGIRAERPDGRVEDIGCAAVILACNGFGGSPELVRRHIPEMADALYFGHAGNQGDAINWGEALGAETRDLGAYQGHGSVAHPHGVLVTWALMMEGGIQVNAEAKRFWNEHEGYSEAAVAVLAQPGGIAFNIYDGRLHALGGEFEDYRQAETAGAIRSARDAAALAALIGVPADALRATLEQVETLAASEETDAFGRRFHAPALAPPYYAVKVTGTLFHTQGGLMVDDDARVLRRDGSRLPNMFAGGGAARGVSGSDVSGYLSGNGLLTAVAYGRIAGVAATNLALRRGHGPSL